ncbi:MULTISPECIES: TetR/AcrR family transcriptional regulator [unclassified Undibacterium]|uniref:TetR/AcrR family transcriptional regulator n=1 Tax=unclassified Undibacterium TaxID=2630295 RepID=UPI002AC8DCB2|nr:MULTISPECIES: TetR family transcriptional regulator [unclassified Undibacterium]MEB0138635.1 TetR family transcriptional regulator [Undibacterium sp. CCC2.1]MEB0171436.1 TetR family transcriptional regulator [Undibacterium sp. CCC1.1]MEB0175766.1 TetR family transcriptional regulator [Undibacterium sp. CCC3.4]MEB0214406.1 TetR family transcriptional regulator [Undibacterium sp. 5I2]WPX44271.1 TetR family transcriptional regulator [Undibacterium sp. CCC3.4]
MNSVDELSGKKRSILIAAEKCFAAQSYEGVSIRDIAHEANVPVALVGYYFGAKNQLYHAIFEYHSAYLNERLLALRATRHGHTVELDAVLAAFVRPLLQLREQTESADFARMVMRGVIDRHEASERIRADFYAPMADELIAALQDALPLATQTSLCRSYQWALGALLHHVLAADPGGDEAADDAALLRFLSHGIRAANAI